MDTTYTVITREWQKKYPQVFEQIEEEIETLKWGDYKGKKIPFSQGWATNKACEIYDIPNTSRYAFHGNIVVRKKFLYYEPGDSIGVYGIEATWGRVYIIDRGVDIFAWRMDLTEEEVTI